MINHFPLPLGKQTDPSSGSSETISLEKSRKSATRLSNKQPKRWTRVISWCNSKRHNRNRAGPSIQKANTTYRGAMGKSWRRPKTTKRWRHCFGILSTKIKAIYSKVHAPPPTIHPLTSLNLASALLSALSIHIFDRCILSNCIKEML